MVNKLVLGTAALAALAAALPQNNNNNAELSYGRTFTRSSGAASATGSAGGSASGSASGGASAPASGSASGGASAPASGSASGGASGSASGSATGGAAGSASVSTFTITGGAASGSAITVTFQTGRPTGACTVVSSGGSFSRSCASATGSSTATGSVGAGAGTATGGAASGTATGGAGSGAATGGAGSSAATGGAGSSAATGGAGSSAATGGAGSGTATGGAGSGAATGGAGSGTATGGAGSGTATGGAGAGTVTGGAGAGTATSSTRTGTATGGAGSGTATGGAGAGTATSSTRTGTATGGTGTGTATGGAGAGTATTSTRTGTATGGTATTTRTGIFIPPPNPVIGTEFTSFPVSGYTDAATTLLTHTSGFLSRTASRFGPDSQIAAIQTAPGPAPPVRSSQVTGPTSHGPFSGVATTTGAVQANATLAASIGTLPPNPTATYYNTNGMLTQPEPAPFQPFGGLGTNGTLPRYMVESDFDYESITLGLYQEWFELDLFHNGLAIFSEQEFLIAGLTAEDRHLIEFFANQETGHATLLTNMLGHTAPPQCTYNYPFRTVREFIDFNQIITRWGEAGVLGFLSHLDSREVAQLLVQSITTESRQQFAFRQMSGLFPMAVWFETGIPQSWQWTYLAPYISSCPQNTTRLAWQNFPSLMVVNQANINRWSPNDTAPYERTGNRTSDPAISTPQLPEEVSCEHLNVTGFGCGPAISRNRSEPLSFPGKQVRLTWDNPGLLVGPNNSYVTSTQAGAPTWVAWVNQLNLTYTPLVSTGPNSGYTYQPADLVFQGDPAANDTMFIAITDANLFLTPFNLSMINPHVRALGIYQAG